MSDRYHVPVDEFITHYQPAYGPTDPPTWQGTYAMLMNLPAEAARIIALARELVTRGLEEPVPIPGPWPSAPDTIRHLFRHGWDTQVRDGTHRVLAHMHAGRDTIPVTTNPTSPPLHDRDLSTWFTVNTDLSCADYDDVIPSLVSFRVNENVWAYSEVVCTFSDNYLITWEGIPEGTEAEFVAAFTAHAARFHVHLTVHETGPEDGLFEKLMARTVENAPPEPKEHP